MIEHEETMRLVMIFFTVTMITLILLYIVRTLPDTVSTSCKESSTKVLVQTKIEQTQEANIVSDFCKNMVGGIEPVTNTILILLGLKECYDKLFEVKEKYRRRKMAKQVDLPYTNTDISFSSLPKVEETEVSYESNSGYRKPLWQIMVTANDTNWFQYEKKEFEDLLYIIDHINIEAADMFRIEFEDDSDYLKVRMSRDQLLTFKEQLHAVAKP